MSKKHRESRTNIAALFGVLKFFKPEINEKKEWTGAFLVNESAVGDGDEGPDRDALLHMIGKASLELIDFMKNHDQLINDYEGALGAIKRMHEIVSALMDMKEEQVDLIVSMETVAGRYKQLIDLVHHLAHDIPSEKCKAVAQNFLAFKGANLQPLVNYNGAQTT